MFPPEYKGEAHSSARHALSESRGLGNNPKLVVVSSVQQGFHDVEISSPHTHFPRLADDGTEPVFRVYMVVNNSVVIQIDRQAQMEKGNSMD